MNIKSINSKEYIENLFNDNYIYCDIGKSYYIDSNIVDEHRQGEIILDFITKFPFEEIVFISTSKL